MDVHLEEKVNSLMLHKLNPQEGGRSGDEVAGLFPHCCGFWGEGEFVDV